VDAYPAWGAGLEMQSRGFLASCKAWKPDLYLFLVALFFFFGAAHVANILISLTVGPDIGLYFEFINGTYDRVMVYALNFIAIVYVTIRLPRKSISLLSLLALFAGYFTFMQVVDLLVVLGSFFALTWWLTSPKPFVSTSRRRALSMIVFYLILIIIVIELLSLICWLIFPVFPQLSQGGSYRYVVDLETKMFLLTGSLAPLLAVLFLFSWVAKPFFHYKFSKRFSFDPVTPNIDRPTNVRNLKRLVYLLLVCSFVLSFLVTVYPYLPELNGDMHPIGVDVHAYRTWLLNLGNEGLLNALKNSFFQNPDRPLSLFTMYLAKYVSGLSALTVAEFFPVVLAPLLVLAAYFFTREALGSDLVASLAAFLSVSSFNVSVGMYAGSLSNWMAIIESYLFMGFFFGSLRKKSHPRMLTALLLSISLLFTHSLTWGMTLGILFVYLLLTLFRARFGGDSRFEIQGLLVIILVNIIVGALRNIALGWSVGNFETLQVAQSTVSIGSLTSFWTNTLYTFFQAMYGFFVNPMALSLAVLGGFVAVHSDRPLNRYLMSWLVCSSIFFVLGSASVIQSSILFNIPLPVFESFGLIAASSVVRRYSHPDKSSSIGTLIILSALLVSLNYALRCAFAMSQLV